MQIVQAPNPVLGQTAKSVPLTPGKKIDKTISELIEGMKIALINQHDPEGIGLAAPQVGKSLRLFIIKESKSAPFSIFINPKLSLIEETHPKTPRKKKSHSKLEGCLSLKDIWGTVKRAPKAKISYLDEKGISHTKIYSGFFATILQHEYDHLQGVLFPRRVLEQRGKLYKSSKDEDGVDIFEPMDLV